MVFSLTGKSHSRTSSCISWRISSKLGKTHTVKGACGYQTPRRSQRLLLLAKSSVPVMGMTYALGLSGKWGKTLRDHSSLARKSFCVTVTCVANANMGTSTPLSPGVPHLIWCYRAPQVRVFLATAIMTYLSPTHIGSCGGITFDFCIWMVPKENSLAILHSGGKMGFYLPVCYFDCGALGVR